MNYYILYLFIGSFFGIYGFRTFSVRSIEIRRDKYAKIAEEVRELSENTPVPMERLESIVAAAILFFCWPWVVFTFLWGRFYVIIFGVEADESAER